MRTIATTIYVGREKQYMITKIGDNGEFIEEYRTDILEPGAEYLEEDDYEDQREEAIMKGE